MKHLCVGLLVAGLLVSVVQAADVTSVNVVGYQRMNVPSTKYVMVASPFYQMGDNSINDVLGDQLTGGTPATGDQCIFYSNSAQAYSAVVWKHPTLGWYQGFTPSTQQVSQALGFWIKSNNVSTDQPVTFAGEVVSENVVTQRVYQGFNMLAYPYNASVAVTNTALDAIAQPGTLLTSDQIIKWDADTQQYTAYWRNANGKWYVGFVQATPTFEMGEAFWYKRVAATADWVEQRPYDL